MSTADIIRAWKDPEYRSTLSVTPAHPAGSIELTDGGLNARTGAGERGYSTYSSKNKCCHTRTTQNKCGC